MVSGLTLRSSIYHTQLISVQDYPVCLAPLLRGMSFLQCMSLALSGHSTKENTHRCTLHCAIRVCSSVEPGNLLPHSKMSLLCVTLALTELPPEWIPASGGSHRSIKDVPQTTVKIKKERKQSQQEPPNKLNKAACHSHLKAVRGTTKNIGHGRTVRLDSSYPSDWETSSYRGVSGRKAFRNLYLDAQCCLRMSSFLVCFCLFLR